MEAMPQEVDEAGGCLGMEEKESLVPVQGKAQ